jgi:putative phage-type endonuclease
MNDVVARIKQRSAEGQRTAEWHVARAGMLTASDVHTAITPAPARSRLLATKRAIRTGVHVEIDAPAMQFGTMMEDGIREYMEKRLGETVHEVGMVRHAQYPWLGASVDGITDSGVVVEIKAPWKRRIVHGQVPPNYMAQIQVQLECLDVEDALYVEFRHCWPDEPDVNVVPVKRDREWFARHLPAMQAFVQDLGKTAAPAPAHAPKKRPPPAFVDGLYLTT